MPPHNIIFNLQTVVTAPLQVLPLLLVFVPLLLDPSFSPAVHPVAQVSPSPTSGPRPTRLHMYICWTHAAKVGI